MSKEDVINYVMTTPNNPNRAVLEGMLEDTSEGGCDCGYECTEVPNEVFNGSLTTTSQSGIYGAFFTPSQPIEDESIVVTLDGTDYTLPKVTTSYTTVYGEADANGIPVFTNYPCAVMVFSGQNGFATPSAGTYQVVIKSGTTLQAEVTECFKQAVVTALPEKHIFRAVETGTNTGEYTFDTTAEQINEWITAGGEVEAVVEKKYPYDGSNFIWCPLMVKKLNEGSSWHFDFIGFNTDSPASTGATALRCYRIFANAGGLSIEEKDIEFRVTN